MSRLLGLRWFLLDLALAVVLLVASREEHRDDETAWALSAALMMAGLLLWRRLPLTAVILSVTGAVGHNVAERSGLEALDLSVLITLFALAASDRPRRTAAITCGVLVTGIVGITLAEPVRSDQAALVPARVVAARPADGPVMIATVPEPGVLERLWQSSGLLLALTAAYLLGANVRGRRMHLRTLERRAADLEREQRQRVALATAAERARITRELHDVVAHGLSVMVVQAQGAAAALRRHPERTENALRDIVTTGRSSLSEMRRLLAIVREEPELAPQPGVDALPELIDRIRAAGTTVTFTVEGDPSPLPAGVDLSAYRIAQEALTNTLKHAGEGATAGVRLAYRPDTLEIEVTNDGAPPGRSRPDSHGNGLRGIAERVRMLDGELSTGPGPTGGFQVLARLPLTPPAPSSPSEPPSFPPHPRAAHPTPAPHAAGDIPSRTVSG